MGRLLSRPSRGEIYAICRFVQRCRARAYRGRSPGFIRSLSSSSAPGKDSSASSNLLTISQEHNTRKVADGVTQKDATHTAASTNP